MCDRRGSIDPGCSWSVFRNDGISAEYLAQSLSDDASREVGNSARRKAKDQVNGLRGELLCLRLKIEVPSNRRHTAEQGDELAPLHRADPKPKELGEYNRLEPCIEAKAVRLCPPWVSRARSTRRTPPMLLGMRGEGAPGVEERLSWTPPPLLSVACGHDPAPCRGHPRSS